MTICNVDTRYSVVLSALENCEELDTKGYASNLNVDAIQAMVNENPSEWWCLKKPILKMDEITAAFRHDFGNVDHRADMTECLAKLESQINLLEERNERNVF